MTDILLTILGTTVFIPFLVTLFRTQWDRRRWSRQLALLLFLLHGVTLLYIPSVMYISAGLLLAGLLLYIFLMRPYLRLTPFMTGALIYTAWFAVTLLWSPMPRKGAQFLVDNGLPLLGMALVGSSTLQVNKEEYTKGIRVLCYTALVFLGMSVLTWLVSCVQLQMWPWNWPFMHKGVLGGEEPFKWVYRWLGGLEGYSHPSYNLLPLFAVTSMAMWLRKQDTLKATGWWGLLSGTLLLTLITQSRMGIIFCVLELIAYIIYMQSSLRHQLTTAAMIAVFAISVIGSTWSFWTNLGEDTNRRLLTEYTWRYIQAKPWTGAGAGALNPIEICHTIGEDYWPHVGYISPDANPTHWWLKSCMLPHNEWMADWAHGGVVAALCVLGLYFCLLIRCARKKRFAETVFLLILILFSLVEPALYIGKGLYLFGYLAGLLYSKEWL